MRNRTHLAEMQAREKEDGAMSGNEREAKAWRKSATILAKLFVSGVRKQDQKLRPVHGTDRSPNSPANLYYLIQLPYHARRNSDRLYFRKRGFGDPTDLATLFDLKFSTHLAAACVYTEI